MENKIWMNKKVFIKLSNMNRAYSGRVISEDENTLTIIDITGKNVQIKKLDCSIIQEEK